MGCTVLGKVGTNTGFITTNGLQSGKMRTLYLYENLLLTHYKTQCKTRVTGLSSFHVNLTFG